MHKRVLVIAGSKDFPGAAYLAGVSALRSGAESVLIMTPEKVAWSINALCADLMTIKLQGEYLSIDHYSEIAEKLRTTDILMLGNGVSRQPESQTLMKELIAWRGTKIIDADALYQVQHSDVEGALLTPNTNEWTALAESNDIERLLKKGNVIIQKGDTTHILAEGVDDVVEVALGLHKAGMGDVLAGLCAGAVAEGKSLLDAARQATSISLQIAKALEGEVGEGHFLASDLAKELDRAHSAL